MEEEARIKKEKEDADRKMKEFRAQQAKIQQEHNLAKKRQAEMKKKAKEEEVSDSERLTRSRLPGSFPTPYNDLRRGGRRRRSSRRR